MSRKTYVEPPMKFNIGMKKYEPDLHIIYHKNTKYPSEKEIRNFILILIAILLVFFILFYISNKFFG